LADGFQLPVASFQKVCGWVGRFSVDGAVALNAALGVEQEVVVAFAGAERRDVIRDHAVEPAGGVGAGDAQEGSVSDLGEGGGFAEDGEFGLEAGAGHGQPPL
jgi:hypothetical protein